MLHLFVSVAIVLLGTLCAGLVRGYVLFVPGIWGMAFGALLGYATGRVGRVDPVASREFRNRIWFVAGAAMLYGIGTVATVSVVRAGTLGLPLEWLADVIKGHEGEVFAGYSKNSFQSVEGVIDGVWWIIFNVLDVGMFAFLFLILGSIGLGDRKTDGRELLNKRRPLGGILNFFAFLSVTIAGVAVLVFWPAIVSSDADVSPKTTIASLQGDWAFDEDATFLGNDDASRTFTASFGLGTELACMSKQSGGFMFTMKPRRDGIFEGQLYVQGKASLSARMRPSEDRNEMHFVVEWLSITGPQERSLAAHRLPTRD